ncbi:LLM class flavin-dependent oxidoreductase [Microbacterium marinilacus]|uniref:LLM class flavin-dependent oxidoreductase n=1 Tax=Microbacterium marinilacus TaxID=415209 RepID=A0ABP7BDI7_9MICO|nr:LLM class flavin-dependent oxidoreductase [Microbacterium marinilacus]MBY0690224.1 LLM class flavin-dependent oxidoreductase [Microbacterium marinilacus]
MQFGLWAPVYGGFLRNVEDEGMPATWATIREVAQTADRLGYGTMLIPELYLNDRKGVEAPSLEAWSLTAAVLAVTERLRVMTAIRPGFHLPAVAAKTISTLSDIAPGRIALNVVAAWWAEEAKQFGGRFPAHDERYDQAREFVEVILGSLRESPFDYDGRFFRADGTIVEPKPSSPPVVFAGGESESGREAIAGFADAYAMHGGTLEEVREKVADLNERRLRLAGAPMREFAMAAYVIVRDTEAEARRELERITTVDPSSPGYASFQEFTANSALNVEVSAREYSVGTRGLRPDLVGTAEQVAERIRAYQDAGVSLLLIQSSPLAPELERIAAEVFPLVDRAAVPA